LSEKLSSKVLYAILDISYTESYYRKVVDNGFSYDLVDFEKFLMFGLIFLLKRRESAAVTNNSGTVDA